MRNLCIIVGLAATLVAAGSAQARDKGPQAGAGGTGIQEQLEQCIIGCLAIMIVRDKRNIAYATTAD